MTPYTEETENRLHKAKCVGETKVRHRGKTQVKGDIEVPLQSPEMSFP